MQRSSVETWRHVLTQGTPCLNTTQGSSIIGALDEGEGGGGWKPMSYVEKAMSFVASYEMGMSTLIFKFYVTYQIKEILCVISLIFSPMLISFMSLLK